MHTLRQLLIQVKQISICIYIFFFFNFRVIFIEQNTQLRSDDF